MKKVTLLAAVVLISMFSSCTDLNEDFNNENEIENINHDELGGDDTEEDGDIDMENAG